MNDPTNRLQHVQNELLRAAALMRDAQAARKLAESIMPGDVQLSDHQRSTLLADLPYGEQAKFMAEIMRAGAVAHAESLTVEAIGVQRTLLNPDLFAPGTPDTFPLSKV